LQKAGNTTRRSHAVAELEQSRSDARGAGVLIPLKLSSIGLLGRNKPALALAPPNLVPVSGHVNTLARNNPNAFQTRLRSALRMNQSDSMRDDFRPAYVPDGKESAPWSKLISSVKMWRQEDATIQKRVPPSNSTDFEWTRQNDDIPEGVRSHPAVRMRANDNTSDNRRVLDGESSPLSRLIPQPTEPAGAGGQKVEEIRKPGRRERKEQERQKEYERRRDVWLARYGSLQALQATFGTAPPWGDLSPQETRSLYHTLLPRSLVGLSEMGLMKPEELAPLAYEARMAAKAYARSRCFTTARLATAAFDQYRNLRRRGLFQFGSSSMSWEEIWQKYEGQIVQEEYRKELVMERYARIFGKRKAKRRRKVIGLEDMDDETLNMRIYLRILERSCSTNQAFDSLFLPKDGEDRDLAAIADELEKDVRDILLPPKDSAKAMRRTERAKKKQRKAEAKQGIGPRSPARWASERASRVWQTMSKEYKERARQQKLEEISKKEDKLSKEKSKRGRGESTARDEDWELCEDDSSEFESP